MFRWMGDDVPRRKPVNEAAGVNRWIMGKCAVTLLPSEGTNILTHRASYAGNGRILD